MSPFGVAIATKEIIELSSWAKTDKIWNEIFLGDIQKAYFAHSAVGGRGHCTEGRQPSVLQLLTLHSMKTAS